MKRSEVTFGSSLPVRSMSARPVVERYGALWCDWDAGDYCEFFAGHLFRWAPTLTMQQPIGLLDRIVDDVMQEAHKRQAQAERDQVVADAGLRFAPKAG